MPRLRHQTWVVLFLKSTGILAFICYLFWNALWLSQGRLPPCIWSSLTRLPCPSSGVTRSVESLLCGDYKDFFLFNPFTVLFAVLFAFSVYRLVESWRAKRELMLPSSLGRLWLVTLVGGWICKLLIGPQYW